MGTWNDLTVEVSKYISYFSEASDITAKWCNAEDDTRFSGRCICSSSLLYYVKCKTDAIDNNKNKIKKDFQKLKTFSPYGNVKTYWPGTKSLPHAHHSCVLTFTSMHHCHFTNSAKRCKMYNILLCACVFVTSYYPLFSHCCRQQHKCIVETHLCTSSSKLQ